MIEYQTVDEEFRPRISKYFSWTVGGDESDDLVQETMIRIQRALLGLRDESNLAPWVFKIARNVLLDRGKQPDRSIPVSRDIAAERFLLTRRSREFGPEDAAVREEMRECIMSLIDGMTEMNRIVLLLSEFDGFSAVEIAATLDISIPNAKIRIHRSRKAFRKTVEAQCRVFSDENSCAACQPSD
jgi:RNA polymerase sigma-70 factor (ECF subfamily)